MIFQKLQLRDWAILALAVIVIVLFYILFFKRPKQDPQQAINAYKIEQLELKIDSISIAAQQQHEQNLKDKVELIQQYETEFASIKRNVNKLYKQLYEELDYINSLDSNDSFNFFSTHVTKKDNN